MGENVRDLKLGNVVIEGKTKKVYQLPDEPGHVLLLSKDKITAGDGAKAHELKGKSVISNTTTSNIFAYLNEVGIKTHFIRQHDEKSFVARHCEMIPIEWVTRRIATGSFLRRNQGVPEGYRFCPPKLEIFFKDDANHDPQWSLEQLVSANFKIGGIAIGQDEVDIMCKTTVCVFEVLEKAWASKNVSLVDMKIEFGVDPTTGEILLADVIDNDSWRIWPGNDKRLMMDKQVYRNLQVVTDKDLEKIKGNYELVAKMTGELLTGPRGEVVIMMGSTSDKEHCERIAVACSKLNIPSEYRVTSAHKGTDETLRIVAEYEGKGSAAVFIAVAGRSNGLGPVTSGNSTFPVINCPPVTASWGAEDIWSSLRLPSGLGCSTVMNPDGAALCAAQILALNDHVLWGRLRAKQVNTWVDLKLQDKKHRNTQK